MFASHANPPTSPIVARIDLIVPRLPLPHSCGSMSQRCICGRLIIVQRSPNLLTERVDRGLGTDAVGFYRDGVCNDCSRAIIRMFWAVENVYIRLLGGHDASL